MNTENKEKLQDLEQCFASLEKITKELKGCMSGDKANPINDKMGALADSLYSSMSALRQTVYNLHDTHNKKLQEHMMNGHAPAFKSNKHLQNFLKACDMESDYTASPKEIGQASYAGMAYGHIIKASKNGIKVELDLNKPKEK